MHWRYALHPAKPLLVLLLPLQLLPPPPPPPLLLLLLLMFRRCRQLCDSCPIVLTGLPHLWPATAARCLPWVDPLDSKLLGEGFISWWPTGNKSSIIRTRKFVRAVVLATQLTIFWAFLPIVLLWAIHMGNTDRAFSAREALPIRATHGEHLFSCRPHMETSVRSCG